MEDLTGLFIGLGLLFFFAIWGAISSSNEKSSITKELLPFDKELKNIESIIKTNLVELSKWVYACNKCQNNTFYVGDISDSDVQMFCAKCYKNYSLKKRNAFYTIDCIGDLNKDIKKLEKHLVESSVFNRLQDYMMGHYQFNNDYAPTNYPAYKIYRYFFKELEVKYFSIKYWSSKKTFRLIPQPYLVTKFTSNGSMLDKIEEKKSRAKMGKLNPNRPALSKTLEKEWNYKSITRGNKSVIIKDWAKTTNQKCPDGRKCGGVRFKELINSDIAYGHILSQDFAKQLPHHHEQVHHPDNLYLTCKSCNSSLGGNNADKELIDRIMNESGTIGDWLRNYINEIKSIKP